MIIDQQHVIVYYLIVESFFHLVGTRYRPIVSYITNGKIIVTLDANSNTLK